ncbi:MAG: hypothetical protein E2O37_10565 [Proteobacteria bacterium]|nr:MAG: hypothetical protein E2O37_10565 [Pseudomonadota bacterium]
MFFVECEKSIPLDVRNVLDTAALLQVTEFNLFRMAYRHWHGRDASERSIEQFFAPYMFRSIVPYWVRQLCRHVLQADVEGTLAPIEFGVTQPAEQVNSTTPFLSAVVVVGAALGMLVIAAGLYLLY